MKISLIVPISTLRLQFNFNAYTVGKVRTTGIYDICEDGRKVLFIDYDKFKFEWLINDIQRLQKTYKLSDFIVLKSSDESYHAICFDKVSCYENQKIVMESNCDEAFKNAPRWDYGSRVLRVMPKGNTDKPVYITTIKSKYNKKRKSLAHLKFFKFNYNIYGLNFKNDDGKQKIYLIDYPTKKNI